MSLRLPLLLCLSLCSCTSRPLGNSGLDGGVALAAQALVVSVETLRVPEGGTQTFQVWLQAAPSSLLTVAVESSNPAALAVAPGQMVFGAEDFAIPRTITVSAPTDSNSTSEVATLLLSAAGLTSLDVGASVDDSTVQEIAGQSLPFLKYLGRPESTANCMLVQGEHRGVLDQLGVFVPVAPSPGSYEMALYDDEGNQPGALLAAMPAAVPLVDGVNMGLPENAGVMGMPDDKPIPISGPEWVCLRTDQQVEIGYAILQPSRVCASDAQLIGLDTPWPKQFGPATCFDGQAYNLWLTAHWNP